MPPLAEDMMNAIKTAQNADPIEPEHPKVTTARKNIERTLDLFNAAFHNWEDTFQMGANIVPDYDLETGKKTFKVVDVVPLPEVKPTPEVAKAAGDKIAQARAADLISSEGEKKSD